MDLVFIIVLTAVVVGFIVYKAVQMNKNKKSSSPSKGGGGSPLPSEDKPKNIK